MIVIFVDWDYIIVMVFMFVFIISKNQQRIDFSLPMPLIIEHHNGEVLFLVKASNTEPVLLRNEKLQNLNYCNMSIGVQVKLKLICLKCLKKEDVEFMKNLY